MLGEESAHCGVQVRTSLGATGACSGPAFDAVIIQVRLNLLPLMLNENRVGAARLIGIYFLHTPAVEARLSLAPHVPPEGFEESLRILGINQLERIAHAENIWDCATGNKLAPTRTSSWAIGRRRSWHIHHLRAGESLFINIPVG